MKSLNIYIKENLSDVEANWHPRKGLFKEKDPNKIASYLLKYSKDNTQALRRLTFYMNRAGDNLTNVQTLNAAKEILKNKNEKN